MKILVICQYYYPEPFRISDICEALVQRGHDVMVVTGVPNYPEGITYSGYENDQKRDEEINGVKVHRCFTVPRKTGAFYRLLNYYSYAASSSWYVSTLPADFDVVFVNQLSPVMMAQAAITYGRKHGKKVVMYCLDLWPESLIAGGVGRNSLLYRLFHHISKGIYTKMGTILVTSRQFSGYLQEQFGIDAGLIHYLPQYAEDQFAIPPSVREKTGIHLTFAGNIGEVQSVETILKAAKSLRDEQITFHIVGGGTDLERLQKMAQERSLSNVIFYGRRPLSEMPVFYQMADAMLVTLKADPVLSLTLPGKVQSCMAAGKPIIGAVDGETARIIEEAKCGFCGPAENAEALAQNIMRFKSDADGAQLGQNARRFYEEHFEKAGFLDELEAILLQSC